MGSRQSNSGNSVSATVPLGGYADVFGAGLNYKPVGSAILRTAYPDLSQAFPASGAGIYTAAYNTISPAAQINAVAYGAGKFIAVGQGGAVYLSGDGGMTWTRQAGGTGNWKAAIYANGLFVIIGDQNSCMTSPDGVTWTNRAIPVTGGPAWSSITFGAGLFVAIAGGYNFTACDVIATSPDGINWTQRQIPGGATTWGRIAYGAGLFVVVATTTLNYTATSPDGINWTRRTMPSAMNWENLIFANGMFMAMAGGVGMPQTSVYATSTDGINWVQRAMPLGPSWSGLAYGNGIFFAVANSGGTADTTAATSVDGISWTIRVVPSGVWGSLAFGDGVFIGGYANNTANSVLRAYIEGATSSYIYLAGTAGKYVRVQ